LPHLLAPLTFTVQAYNASASETTCSLNLVPLAKPEILQDTRNRVVNRLHLPWEERIAPLASMLGMQLQGGQPLALEKEQIIDILRTSDKSLENAVYDYAGSVTERFFGKKIYFRGIVEFSNVCSKDCYYCGIRKHVVVQRYSMPKEEILSCAKFVYESGYGSLMLQSGELPTEKRLSFLVDIIEAIKREAIQRDIELNGKAPTLNCIPSCIHQITPGTDV